MTDPFDRESLSDLERLIRAAGEYVQPSIDLRPRVMEEARMQSSERKARRIIRYLAVAVFLLGVLTSTNKQEIALATASPASLLGSERVAREAEEAARRGNAVWGTVEAFSGSRFRHAQAFKQSL
jgi:hypothetical protein